MIENKVVINTAVVPFMCGLHCVKGEAGRVIDSWPGPPVGSVVACEVDAELTSRILWLHRADDCETVALEEHSFLQLFTSFSGDQSYIRRKEEVCEQGRH